MIQADLRLLLRNISSRDSSMKTRKLSTSSPGSSGKRDDPGDEVGKTPQQLLNHLLCSRATSGFTLPFHNRFNLVGWQFCFSLIRKSKNDFYFGFHPAVTPLHMNCFVKFEFLIAWILGRGNWKQKVKTTNWPFSIFSFWFSKYWRMMFNFTFLSNKHWKLRL